MPGLHLVFSENQLSRSHIVDSYNDLKHKGVSPYRQHPTLSIVDSCGLFGRIRKEVWR